MTTVSFSEAKEIIQDGDIVFVHGSPYNLVQALIMFFTGSCFSHCCIAFRVQIGGQERVVVVESQGKTKRRILPLSYYKQYDMSIVAAPKPWNEVKHVALRDVGRAKYNMIRAIYVGICEYVERRFKKKLPEIHRLDEICSEFCGDVYGLKVNGSPQVLYDMLMNITHERSK